MKKPLSKKQLKAAKRLFPKQARNERAFTSADYATLPQSETRANARSQSNG